MPIKINVGLSKKIGLPDYGSLGASCNVEFEADCGALDGGLETFHRKVKNAFTACRQAVQEELARQPANGTSPAPTNGHAKSNGHASRNGKQTNGRKATASQVRAIHAIINRQGLDLLQTLRDRFGVDYAEDLAINQASELIDELKAVSNGKAR
jgi:hypothetical protein